MMQIGICAGLLGTVYLLGGWHNLRRYRETGTPSEGSGLFLRGLGVVFLIVSGILIISDMIPPVTTQEERLEKAWRFKDGIIEEARLVPTLWEGLPVDDALTSPDRAPDELPEPVTGYAFVGEDDHAIPDDAMPTDAQPDDLVIMTASAPVCEPSRLVVEELPHEVRVTVVTIPGPQYQEAWQEALDEQAERDESLRSSLLMSGATPEEADAAVQRHHDEHNNRERYAGLPEYLDPTVPPACNVLDAPGSYDQSTEWRLIHVPLDRPLRGRKLIDTATGDVVQRVATDAGSG